MKLELIAVAVLLAFCVFPASAISPGGDFRCLADQAHQVVVVRDLKNDRFVIDDYLGPLFKTTLVVKKRIKGPITYADGRKIEAIDLLVRRGLRDSAGSILADHPRALVFLRNSASGPVILGGAAGVLPYDGGVSLYGVRLNDKALAIYVKRSSGYFAKTATCRNWGA